MTVEHNLFIRLRDKLPHPGRRVLFHLCPGIFLYPVGPLARRNSTESSRVSPLQILPLQTRMTFLFVFLFPPFPAHLPVSGRVVQVCDLLKTPIALQEPVVEW